MRNESIVLTFVLIFFIFTTGTAWSLIGLFGD